MNKKKGDAFPELDDYFLKQRIAESKEVIAGVLQSMNKPLVIQFSGPSVGNYIYLRDIKAAL